MAAVDPASRAIKVAILAGGAGSRLAEETRVRPKPLVEIGGRPILWHIMRHYAHFGCKDFVVATGYKGDMIEAYMDGLFGSGAKRREPGDPAAVRYAPGSDADWSVCLVDTGEATMTGGRVKRLAPYLGGTTFMLTWGDGLSDVPIDDLLAFHTAHGKLATVTAVRPPARYGHLEFDGDRVHRFTEKPQTAEGWINGAFFVLEAGVFATIDGDDTQWERQPMERLAAEGELMAYKHTSFWQCMDTLREKHILEEMWAAGRAPWKTWK